MKLKIAKTHPDAKEPVYATDGAAAFDLYAATAWKSFNGEVDSNWNDHFDTGLAFEIPEGHVMLVFSRSGFGFKNHATLVNAVGVIDSDYRGSVQVRYNRTLKAGAGDRIAQGIVLPVEKIKFEFGDLSETERGSGGFGSTGKE